MDSIKAHWREWNLFDHGRIPIGHMHSNILQLALERGIPVLLAWFTMLIIYGQTLQNAYSSLREHEKLGASAGVGPWRANWLDRGIVLGAFGGLIGFLTSGVVHYNWGDSEVIMIFYFVMGLSLGLIRHWRAATSTALSASPPKEFFHFT